MTQNTDSKLPPREQAGKQRARLTRMLFGSSGLPGLGSAPDSQA